jgi:hypothetical protein
MRMSLFLWKLFDSFPLSSGMEGSLASHHTTPDSIFSALPFHFASLLSDLLI